MQDLPGIGTEASQVRHEVDMEVHFLFNIPVLTLFVKKQTQK